MVTLADLERRYDASRHPDVVAGIKTEGWVSSSQKIKFQALALDQSAPDLSVLEGLHVDILVNNAGMQHRAPLEDFPPEAFERLLQTHGISQTLLVPDGLRAISII